MGFLYPRSGCRCTKQFLSYGLERFAHADGRERTTAEPISVQWSGAGPTDQRVWAKSVYGGK